MSLHDEIDTVHACYCLSRRRWLVWTKELSFWRILQDQPIHEEAAERDLRMCINFCWERLWMVASSWGHPKPPPLSEAWRLIVHAPKPELSAFMVPSVKRNMFVVAGHQAI